MTNEQLARWRCTSYCLYGSRKGHFERRDDGEWVRYADIGDYVKRLIHEAVAEDQGDRR